MSDKTKACNLTEIEVKELIAMYGRLLYERNIDDKVERIKYLNSRLKTFSEGEIKSQPNAAGWTTGAEQNG